jgi:hypothetical protein
MEFFSQIFAEGGKKEKMKGKNLFLQLLNKMIDTLVMIRPAL